MLQLTADGLTAEQAGKRLILAGETVKQYKKRAIAKLGARNSAHAVTLGIRRGLIS